MSMKDYGNAFHGITRQEGEMGILMKLSYHYQVSIPDLQEIEFSFLHNLEDDYLTKGFIVK